MLQAKRILLIISGGIAAYKSLDLIRRLREREAIVRCVLTRAGSQFVTPLSVQALSENKVYQKLFSLTDESEMGHIRLSREADLVVVAPATADLLAKMAHGRADDLASTLLLATDKPVMVAPTMNVEMWQHKATQRNVATLREDEIHVIGPADGDLACGEIGSGRMSEPADILAVIERYFGIQAAGHLTLVGRRVLVTSGPTYEAIDPVRYIANRSSGRQGHAIARGLAQLGAEVVLVSGPTNLPDPQGMEVVHVESARDMHIACHQALPVDVAICAAAVADWRAAAPAQQKIKKDGSGKAPPIEVTENPDILRDLSNHKVDRPALVIGFAAETQLVATHAREKMERKGCDWIVANDVSEGTGVMGGSRNTVHLIIGHDVDSWPTMTKEDVAARLGRRIAEHFRRQ